MLALLFGIPRPGAYAAAAAGAGDEGDEGISKIQTRRFFPASAALALPSAVAWAKH